MKAGWSKSFVPGLSADEDHDGHGTHSAHLALLVAPHTKLFVARIVRYGTTGEFNAKHYKYSQRHSVGC